MKTLATALLGLAGAVCLAVPAAADFSPPQLMSGTQQIQFDEATAPTLSQDGRYLVFQGSLAGVAGVYRRNLQSGEVQPVAVYQPPQSPEAALSAPDATGPSVSADGRFIAFTTTADLEPAVEPASDRGCPEVYVRDMESSGPAAYTLVSALDRAQTQGSQVGISYAPGSCTARTAGLPVAGAQASPAVAISADGRHVAFTVLSPSNLTTGPAGPLTTPASQVAVRDLDEGTTTLVSVTPEGRPTPGGGAFPSTDSEAHISTQLPDYEREGDQITGSTAAISADASTVAWLGSDVPAQVPGASEIAVRMGAYSGRDSLGGEVEPLWRRVADGPGAVTRRLLGGGALDLYFNRETEFSFPVLGGSFVNHQGLLFIPPALSANGQTVAFVANAPAPAAEPTIDVGSAVGPPNTDAYVVHVDDQPQVEPQLTAVTATDDYAAGPATVGDVKDIAISPDGTRVAFDTTRTQFLQASPALISPPSTYDNIFQTYEANLLAGTLQRVASTYDGSSPNGNAGLLAFTGEDQTLAFSSEATNLFFGDSTPASQVYLVQEALSGAQVAPQLPSGPLSQSPPNVAWLLSATASAQRDGSVLVSAEVPGAGRLTVHATAQLPSTSKVKRAPKHKAKQAKRARATKKSTTAHTLAVPARSVGTAQALTAVSAELHVRVRVLARYKTLLAGKTGLYSVLQVSFAAPGHRTLVQDIPVTMRIVTHDSRTKAKK